MPKASSKISRLRPTLTRSCLLGFTSFALAMSHAHGAVDTWIGNVGANWSTPLNWSGGVPTNGSTLFFGPSGTAGATLSDDIASLTVGSVNADGIDFAVNSDAYTINRPGTQTITLASSGTGIGISQLANNLVTFNVPIVLASNQTIQVGGTTGNPTLAALTLNGAISGTGFRLTKTGSGTLTLGSTNTFTGGVTVNGGALVFTSDAQLGTAPAAFTANNIIIDGGQFASGNTLTLSALRGIVLGNATANSGGTINTSGIGISRTTTYNGVIANNGAALGNSLTKTGSGSLVLGGPNTYTGSTIINQGTIQLNFAAGATGANATPLSNIISGGSALVMGGVQTSFGLFVPTTTLLAPTLIVSGVNGGLLDSSQTFNGLTLNQGSSNLVVNGGTGSTSATLNLGAITHNAGGSLTFTTLNNSGGTGLAGTITTSTTNTNGILGGWATYATGSSTTALTAALVPTDWAANDGSGNVVAYAGYADFGAAAGTIANTPTSNVRVLGTSGAVSLGAGLTDINTLLVSDAAARTITTGSGNTLRLGASGGIFRSNTAATTLTIGANAAAGGTLTAGGADNTPGELNITANGTSTTVPAITVNSAIADNGTGAVSVVKTGNGILLLNKASTYTGGTIVNQGTVFTATGVGTTFGTGPVTVLSTGTISLNSTGTASATLVTYANNFTFAGSEFYGQSGTNTAISGTVTLAGDTQFNSSGASSTNTLTLTGKVTGSGNASFIAGTVAFSNPANDFSGDIAIGGSVSAGGVAGGGTGRNSTLIRLGANNALPNGAGTGNIGIAGQPSPFFNSVAGTYTQFYNGVDLNGFSATINGLNSYGGGASTEVINSGATASTLTLGGNNQSSNFGGRIIDTNGYQASGTGTTAGSPLIQNPANFTSVSGSTVAIVKIGTGVFTATGANVYSGGTTVNAGTFRLGTETTMQLSTGTMTVAGGRLDSNFAGTVGTVNLGGNLTMTSGVIDPNGNNVGMLTLAANRSLTISGGTLNLTLTSTSAFDSIAGSGTGLFSITGGTLDLGGVVGAAGNSYQLLSGFASGSVAGLSYTDFTTSDGSTPSLSNTGLLSFAPVPEPSTWTMGGLLMMALAGYAVRRQRRTQA